ncbi:MAG: trigger factor [Alphaproteobacteria bacterium]|nr:trigger factor [Alphaproteobacteria bacterium]
MQVKELKNEGLSRELEVIVTAKDIDAHINERLLEVGKTLKVAGFRPGKVPMTILKQRYGKAVLGEVLEIAVNKSTREAMEQQGIRPAYQPKIEVKEFDEGKDLKFTMEVETLPEVKLMDLKTIKVEKPITKPDDKAIDEALERIAKQARETEEVTEDRAAKKGDVVVINFKGRTADDNKEHAGMAAEGTQLELGGGQFIPGFEDQLTGKKKGAKVDVKVTFPTPYHSKELEGRDAIFETEILSIRQPVAAKIDDDFAKKLGLDDVKALRKAISEQMESEYSQFSRMKLKRSLLDVLDDGHSFEIPKGMLDLEFQNIRQQVVMERQADVKDGKLELSAEEEEELQAIAERRVRLGMILSEIGRGNNIQITNQELQRAVIAEAQKYPGQEATVFEYFRKTPQAIDALRAPVFEDKVVDFVLELATVTEKEVSLEDLTADDEESYLDSRKKKGKGGASKAPAKKAAAKDDAKGEEGGDKPAAKAKKKAS